MNIRIDQDRCSGCGECVRICPHRILEIRGRIAAALSEECLECGQCRAVCPEGAISMVHDDPDMAAFENFASGTDWLEWGDFDTGELVRLMRSRRSCRNFTDRPVDESLLRDLVRIGVAAPSGTNSQKWTFTLIPDRASLLAWGDCVAAFFRKLNAMAEKRWLRAGLRLLGKPELDEYHRRHHASVSESLRLWDHESQDRLFHGASAAIVIGSAPGASCPVEDALLATQNILLGAHALGLGTCLIGYCVEAAKRDPAIKTALSMPRDENIHAVIALGWPAVGFRRTTGRRAPVVRTARP